MDGCDSYDYAGPPRKGRERRAMGGEDSRQTHYGGQSNKAGRDFYRVSL
jgi:hypothetical protein